MYLTGQFGTGAEAMERYQRCLMLAGPPLPPYTPPCTDSLSLVGHGVADDEPANRKCLCKGIWKPDGLTRGFDSSEEYTPDDVEFLCGNLCPGATLYLYGCGVGHNEDLMRHLASKCPKIKRVCGYLGALRYIRTGQGDPILLPNPFYWHCIEVNN